MIVYAQEAISHFDNKYVVVGHQSEKYPQHYLKLLFQ